MARNLGGRAVERLLRLHPRRVAQAMCPTPLSGGELYRASMLIDYCGVSDLWRVNKHKGRCIWLTPHSQSCGNCGVKFVEIEFPR